MRIKFNSRDLISVNTGTSSKGNQRKWITPDKRYYIKENFIYQEKVWRDDKVEALASQYSRLCRGIARVVEYRLCSIDGRPGCISMNFCEPEWRYIPFLRVVRQQGFKELQFLQYNSLYVYNYILEVAKSVGVDYRLYLDTMILLDFVCGNEDRHLMNFGFMFNDKLNKFAIPPLFDFGLGLFEHDMRYTGVKFRNCLEIMECKPFCLGSDRYFNELIAGRLQYFRQMAPNCIRVSDFDFPSEKGETLFRNRNLKLGVKLL